MIDAEVNTPMNLKHLIFPQKSETSGLFENQNPIYTNCPAASKFPLVLVPCLVKLDDENFLFSGYYEVRLSHDKKFLVLFQADKPVLKICANKVENVKFDYELENEEKILKKKLEIAKTKHYNRKISEYEEKLKILEKRRRMKYEADFEKLSDNVFRINYKDENNKAEGYIKIDERL